MLTDWRDEVLAGVWSRANIAPINTTPIAISLDVMLSTLTLTVSDGVLTLARAGAKQYKLIYNVITSTKVATVTADFVGGSRINFNKAGDGAILQSNGQQWVPLALLGKAWGDIQPTPPILSTADYQGILLNSISWLEFFTGAGGSYEISNETNFMFVDMSSDIETLTFENDGVPGQYKMIIVQAGGNICTVSSALFKGFSSIQLKDTGDGCILYHNGEQWQVIRLLNDAKKV